MAANVRHDSRVHLIAPLPSLIHCSARAALVVEGDDPFGRAAHVRHDEADPRIKLARMPLDLGNHPARLGPACRLVGEIGVVSPDLVGRSSDRTLEQIADPVLQDLVGGQTDRIFDPLGLQVLVDARAWRMRHRPGNRCVRPCRDNAR